MTLALPPPRKHFRKGQVMTGTPLRIAAYQEQPPPAALEGSKGIQPSEEDLENFLEGPHPQAPLLTPSGPAGARAPPQPEAETFQASSSDYQMPTGDGHQVWRAHPCTAPARGGPCHCREIPRDLREASQNRPHWDCRWAQGGLPGPPCLLFRRESVTMHSQRPWSTRVGSQVRGRLPGLPGRAGGRI